ncbi:filamentous hemagglutinin N-terminal domain-containing protein [Parendozoicomonas sp. Alg238-R29]|uniref:beta strand repeat-containing protein n=1 Tax=Parendozoicomonas sp. Alg238-R29 TaxID=2993446 RepID=UPI00248EFBD6|nr:filamentous hemagglutinin N-terminal domain-containing protein [Parendozoicomonas sp. Alg238-R29]
MNTIDTQSEQLTVTRKSRLKPLAQAISMHRIMMAPTLIFLSAAGSQQAMALPAGIVEVEGVATAPVTGNTLTINQSDPRAYIKWQEFNINAGETVKFVQPSSSALVLNDIIDNNPSQIFGQIDANGHVLLVNPRGILFSENATVNVNSLTASTLTVDRNDFLNSDLIDGLAFTEGNASGAIINRGMINAAKGVVLQGGRVENSGTIRTIDTDTQLITAGLVALAKGGDTVLTFDADGYLGLAVNAESSTSLGVDSAVLNTDSGSIQAGKILLEANMASSLFDNAVNNEGVLEARGIHTSGGTITLRGSGGSVFDVVNTNTIDASATGANSIGGTVLLAGDDISLTNSSLINANGGNAGGKVLIGSDLENDPTGYYAKNVVLDGSSSIQAGATKTGSRDGGRIEISAQENLNIAGTLNAEANSSGTRGSIILRSSSIEVTDSDTSGIRNTSLSSAITNDSDVTLIATKTDDNKKGNIDINAAIAVDAKDRERTLTLQAENDIAINATVENGKNDNGNDHGGDFNITVDAGNTFHVATSGTVDTGGGDLNVNTQNLVNAGTIDLKGYFGSDTGTHNINIGRDGAGSTSTSLLGTFTGQGSDFTLTTGAGSDTFVFTDGTYKLSDNSFSSSVNTGNLNLDIASEVDGIAIGSAQYIRNSDGTSSISFSVSGGKLEGTENADTFTLYNDGSNYYLQETGSTKRFYVKDIDGLGSQDTLTEDASSDFDQALVTGNKQFSLHRSADGNDSSADLRLSNIDTVTTASDVVNQTGSDLAVQVWNGDLILTNENTTFQNLTGYQGNGGDNITDSNDSNWQTSDTTNSATSNGVLYTGIDRVNSLGQVSSSSTLDQTVKFHGSRDMELKGIRFSGADTFNGDSTGNRVDTVEDLTTGSSWAIRNPGTGVTKDGQFFNNIDAVKTSNNARGRSDSSSWSLLGTNKAKSDQITFEFTDNDTTISNVGQVINETAGNLEVSLESDDSLKAGNVTFAGASSYLGLTGNNDTVLDNRNADWAITSAYQARTGDAVNNALLTFFNISEVDTTGAITNTGAALNITLDQVTENVLIKNTIDTGSILFTGSNSYTGAGADNVTDNLGRQWYLQGSKSLNTEADASGFNLSAIHQMSNVSSVENATNGELAVSLESNSDIKAGDILFTDATSYTGSGSDNIEDKRTAISDWQLTADNTAHTGTGNGQRSFTGIDYVATTGGISNSTSSEKDVTLDRENGTNKDTINLFGITFAGSRRYTGSGLDNITDNVTDNRNLAWEVAGPKAVRTGTGSDLRTFSGIDSVHTTATVNGSLGDTLWKAGSDTDSLTGITTYKATNSDISFTGVTTINNVGTLENDTGSQQTVTVNAANNGLILQATTFNGASNYTGSGSDIVDDNTDSTWQVTATNSATQVSGSRGFTGIAKVKTEGDIANQGAGQQTVTLNTEELSPGTTVNTLKVAEITFEGNGDYTGSGTDGIQDNTSSHWNLDGDKTVIQRDTHQNDIRQLTGITSVTGGGSVSETSTNNWVSTGQNAAKAQNVTFTTASQINTQGRVSSELSGQQTVTARDNSLELNGVNFVNAAGFDGADGRNDKVEESSTQNWQATDTEIIRNPGANQQTFTNIGRVTTDGDIDNSLSAEQTVILNQETVDTNTVETLKLNDVLFVGTGDYTGNGIDNIDDQTNRNWGIKGDNAASQIYGLNNERLFTGIDSVTSTGKVSNITGADLTVTIDRAATTLSAHNILFSHLSGYIGDANQTDTINGALGTTWYLTGINRLNDTAADNGFLLSHVDEVNGGITSLEHSSIYSSGAEVVIRPDSKLNVGDILFSTVTSYTGNGSDNVTDNRTGQDWSIIDTDPDVSAIAIGARTGDGLNGNRTLTLSGIDSITTTNNASGKTADSAWSVKDGLTASSDGITFNFQHSNGQTPQISNVGLVSNQTSAGKTATINNDQSLTVNDIQFADATGYTGHSSQTDIVTDSTNKSWNLDDDHDASQIVSDTESRAFTNIARVNTQGDITETGTNNWESTGDNSAKAGSVEFVGTSKVTTAGRVFSSVSTAQTVTVNDGDLTLNQVAYTGATGFDGDNLGSRQDTIDDNRTTPTDWQITDNNDASSNTLTFNDIDAVSTAGNARGRTTDSAWAIKGSKKAQSDGILFTLESSTPEISNVGVVSNEFSTQKATLNSDSSLSVADLTFLDISGYTGMDGNGDSLVDNRGTGWTITGDYTARSGDAASNNLITFSKISAVQNAGAIVDSQNSNWSVNIDSSGSSPVTTTTDGHITFRGASSVDTAGSLTNATGSEQSITLSLISGAITTAFDALGISFKNAGDYIGNGGDNINDTTNTDWAITSTGADQKLDSMNSRSFSGIDSVASTGALSNDTGSELDISLGQAVINENGLDITKETISTGSLTFTGSRSYSGSGLDNITDTVSRVWYLTAVKHLNTEADNSGYDLTGIDQFTGIDTIQNQAADLDVTVGITGNDNALTAGDILFNGANSYVGSGTDNVNDNRTQTQGWNITGANSADTGQVDFSGIDSVTTATNAAGRTADSAWSVTDSQKAQSDGITFTFTDTDTEITNVGTVSNATGDGLDVELKADSSLQLADINFADATDYQGHEKTAPTDKGDKVSDKRNQKWIVTGDNALDSGNLSFTEVDAVDTSAEIDSKIGEAWVVTEENNKAIATSNNIAFTGINQVNLVGALTNSTGTFKDVIIKRTTNALELMGISFGGANHYAGHQATTGGDTITDENNSSWRLDGDRTATQLGANRQFVNIAEVDTTGAVSNGTNSGQNVTLKDDQLSVGNITFDGSTDYAGRAGDGDHVIDETTGTGNWLAKGSGETHFDTHQLTNIESVNTSRGVTNDTGTPATETVELDDDSLKVAGIDYQGTTSYTGAGDHIEDNTTETTDWQATGAHAVSKERAGKAAYSLTGINSVQSDKGIANKTGSSQAITLDDDSLTVAGVDFQGTNTSYSGDTAGDILTDSTGGSDSWSVDSERTVSKNGQSLSGIKHLKTGKNIAEVSTSDWDVTDTGIAYGQTHQLTVEGSSEITTTGLVSNNSQSGQSVTLEDTQLTVAGMVFKGSTDYTGRSGNGDIIDDQTNGTGNWLAKGTGEAHKGNHELRNIETLKTDNGVTNDTGSTQTTTLHDDRIHLAGVDYQGSQDYTGADDIIIDSTSDNLAWQVQVDDATANTLKASKNGYDLKNIAEVRTDNALQNATGSSKEVTLSDNTLTVASTADSIAFEDVTTYTGDSDHVTDNTSGSDLWQVKGSGNTSKGKYTLNSIAEIATSKGIQNSSDANQVVTQARDNLTVGDIEYQGATAYTGHSNKTDVVNSDRDNWQLSGNVNTASTTNSSNQTVTFHDIGTVNTAGNGALTGSEANETFTITGTNSVNTQGMTFNGVTSLDAGENATNSDTDTLKGSGETWTLTEQTNEVGAAGITASNVEQVTDTGTASARGKVVGTSGDDEFDLNENQSPNSLIANGILFTGIDDLDGNGSLDKDIVSSDNAVWKLLEDAKAILTNGITITNINSIQDGGEGTVEGSDGIDTFTLTGADSFDAKDISFSGISTIVGQGDDIAEAGSNATIDWQLTGGNKAFSVGSMNFSGIARVEDNNRGQLTGTAETDTFNITGTDELSAYGMGITGIRMILAGDGADQLLGNSLSWTLGDSADNEVMVSNMTFLNIEGATDQSGNGSFTGSARDDLIQWQGGGELDSRGVNFSGVTSIDGGDGNDTVYVDGEVNSLVTLTGGTGSEDLLVNRTPIDGNALGWDLQLTTSSLGGKNFTGFERLSHELDTITLNTNSTISLSANEIRTENSLNTSIETGAVPQFAKMTLSTSGGVNGFAKTDVIDSNSTGAVNITAGNTLTVDDIISGGDVAVEVTNGDLLINGLVSAGGSGQVDLNSVNGSLLADGDGVHIQARDISLSAGQTVGSQELQFLIDTEVGGTVDIVANQYVSPLFTDAEAKVSTIGERLLSVSEAVALSGFRSSSQQLVNQLGNVDPAIFTEISSFSVAENSAGDPQAGDFMLVQNGNATIEGLPIEATAGGDGINGNDCATPEESGGCSGE